MACIQCMQLTLIGLLTIRARLGSDWISGRTWIHRKVGRYMEHLYWQGGILFRRPLKYCDQRLITTWSDNDYQVLISPFAVVNRKGYN
jgi:hypothetical protein